MSDLDSILSGRETAPAVQETIKETTEDSAQEPIEQEASTPTDEGSDNHGSVPVAALQAERQKAKTYKEQVADFERKIAEQNSAWEAKFNQLIGAFAPRQQIEPQKAPDFWEAPETAIDYRLSQTVAPLQSQLMQMREDFSKMQAIDKHGQDAVDAAYADLAKLRNTGDPAFATEYQRIMSSPHPYGSLVEWHKRQQVMAEIGSDPAAYKEKLKAEVLADLQGSRTAAPAAGVMPSNFATARNVGSRSGPAWSGPAPIQDIFKR